MTNMLNTFKEKKIKEIIEKHTDDGLFEYEEEALSEIYDFAYRTALEEVEKKSKEIYVSWSDRTDGRDDSYDDAFEDGTEVMQKRLLEAIVSLKAQGEEVAPTTEE